MTIQSPTITPDQQVGEWRLAWTGAADQTVRVFINGFLALGPTEFATTEKEVVVSLVGPSVIEVHENDADEIVDAAGIELARRPLVWWSVVANAVDYRIYVGEVQRTTVLPPSGRHGQHELEADERVDGGVWTTLRVESVSSSGNETASPTVPLFVPGVLTEPTNLTVTGGGGTFAIEVTA